MPRPVAFLLCVLLVALTPPPTPAGAQPLGADEQAAAADAAVELSFYEAAGDFNALYDRIHPDAHAVIPRAAAIGWFQEAFAPRGPGVATVTGVRFVEWTWAVTGTTYPITAEVSYEQPFADGTVEADVVRLVRDRDGAWRWFFGRDRAFVEAQIARFVPSVPPGGGGRVNTVIGDVDLFWARAFGGGDLPYASPGVVGSDEVVGTGCGEQRPVAAYCASDQTIYYAPAFFTDLDTQIGDFAWIVVLAHEWGHHVQFNLGFRPAPGPAFELQADCAAGAYTRDAATRGLLAPGDVTEAVTGSSRAGDPVWLPQDQPGAHGTSDDRITAFMAGYLGGLLGCGISLVDEPTGQAAAGLAGENPAGLASFLPTADHLPPGLAPTDEIRRSLPEVASGYADPAAAEQRFAAWGWRGQAGRGFGPAANVRLAATATTTRYVSLHRFGDAAAAAALAYSADDQTATTAGARAVAIGPVGDEARALTAPGPVGNEVTVYARAGDVLVRVTAGSAAGDPIGDAPVVTRLVVASAANAG